MKPDIRRAVAFIAISLVNNRQMRNIFDLSDGANTFYSGDIKNDRVNIYDYSAGCFIVGPTKQFYHYGRACHVSFNLNGNKFSGYDYGSGTHYSGAVNGSNCTIYDYGAAQYINYRAS